MHPHARNVTLFACFALALVCVTSRVRSQVSAVRRVTDTSENATSLNPTLSGDGGRIVFESTANLLGEAGGQRFRVFSADVMTDLRGFLPLAPSRAPAAAVSQDGSSVAFASVEDLTGENADRNSEIFLSTGSRVVQLTHTTPGDPSSRARDGNFQPSISDDGRIVAFASNRDPTGENTDGNSEIFIYETSNSRFTQLTNTSGASGAHDAKLSGDGSSVAFVRDNSPTGSPTPQLDLALYRSTTKSFLTLAEHVARLALSPARSISDDGTRVVYSAETAANTTQVFLYDGRNAATRQLTHLSSRVSDVPLDPTISGDGARVAFATRRSVVGGNSDGGVELYLYDIPSNQLSRVTDAPSAATAEVVASLDDAGSHVAFNFPRVLGGAVSSEEFANNSEIFLASLAPRAPFSSDLKFRHAAIPNRDLANGQSLAPGQIATARGANLALASAQAQRLSDGTFPRSFRNTSVSVNGRAAQLFFVSTAQVNFQIPEETEIGAAEIVVRNHDGYESRAVALISRAAPGLFTERGDGTGAAVVLDSATHTRAPFDPHDGAGGSRRVTLFSTGVRHAEIVAARIAGREMSVESVTPAPDLPGLEEIRVRLPRALAGAGVVPVSITADGRTSNEASVELIGARRVARVTLAPSVATLGAGRSLRYHATAFDEDGEEIIGARVDFSSDDSSVATIDADGVARALREGETRIRVAAGDVTAEAVLRCRALSLIINEVLADPPDGAAGDANRDGQRSASQDEFIEIVNASDIDLDLGGYRIATRDAAGAETIRHAFATGLILPPGAASVVFGGASAATFDPHDPAFAGARVVTASTGGLSLLNGGATVVLLDPSGAVVEEMSYGAATDLEGDRNQSLTRAPDVTGDFVLHQTLAGASSRLFSPGAKSDGAPFQITAPVAHVEVEPASCEAQVGATCRFTARALDGAGRELRGIIFDWQPVDENIATIDRDGTARALRPGVTQITVTARGTRSAPAQLFVVPPPRRVFRVEVSPGSASVNRGGIVQLRALAFDQNGAILPDAAFVWSTDSAAIASVDANGHARGAGVGLANLTASTGDGAGGFASARATLEVKLPITISEVLADVQPDDASTAAVEGDANRDGVRDAGDDEFVELFNPSDSAVDLSGVRVADATADRYTFPAGTTLEAGRALVVFGGGKPPTGDPAFGASLVRVASSLNLNDGGDTVALKLKVGSQEIALASLTYGAQGSTPAPADQSLTREREPAGDPGAGYVAHLSAANAASRAFSPGTLPDGAPFGSPLIARVEIAPPSTAIEVGASQAFTARAFADGSSGEVEVANVSFAWDVSAPSLVSPAPTSGTTTNVSAHAYGSLTVRARAGGREAFAALVVNSPPPVLTRVELSPTSASIFVGGAQQFTARAFDQYEHPYANAQITFSSSDPGIAAPGVVTPEVGGGGATVSVAGLRAGAARIAATASQGARTVTSSETSLRVVEPPPVVKYVVVAPADALINRGQTRQFTARAFDQNDQPLANASFSWTTSDSQAATITNDGLARGVGVGTTSVVATTPSGAGQTVSGQAALDVRAPLVVNEILADVPPDNAGTANVEGDANRDGTRNSDDDEFVELLNNSGAPLDLSGVVVADSVGNRFTFPANTTLAAGQAAIIFGGGTPPTSDPAFGGSLIFATSSLGLNDGGDIVNVKLPTPGGDILIASQSYGSAAVNAPAAPVDQSLTRAPDAEVAGAGGGFVAHAAAARAAGRVLSPGTRADGTPFGSPTLARIEIAPAPAQLEIGARQTFNARAFASVSGAEIEVSNVSFIWDAGDATKASLAPTTGASTNATALIHGTTNVRAQAGGLQISIPLTINPPPPVLTRVELVPITSALYVGQAQQLTARAFDQFDQPFHGATYSFASDDANVARVDSTTSNDDASAVATLSGRAAGTAHVTATASAGAITIRSGAATLDVNPPPPVLTRIDVAPASATVAAGEAQQFTARGFDQDGREIGGLAFAWASSDKSVAAIDQSGLAEAIKAGATQINASSGGVTSAPATLNVTAPPVAAAGQVIINEALVSFSTSTTQTRADFVELYNTAGKTLDISGLVVSFRPAGSGSTPSVVTLPGAVGSLTTLIQPHAYFLIANGASTFGVVSDYNAGSSGFDLNGSTGGIKIEIGGIRLDGLSYQSGTTAPPAPFNAYGEGSPLVFTSGATNDLIRSPNAANTHNNAADFKRNGTTASVTPRAPNP